MEQEKELNIDESLKIIRQMVNAGETRLNDRGIHFIVAGALISIAAIIHAVFIKSLNEDLVGCLWAFPLLLGMMFSLFYEVKYFRPYINESMIDKLFFRIILAFIFLLINTVVIGSCIMEINSIPFISLELCAFYTILTFLFEIAGIVGKSSGAPFFIFILVTSKGSMEKSLFMLSATSAFTLILPGILLYRKSINKPLFKKMSKEQL